MLCLYCTLHSPHALSLFILRFVFFASSLPMLAACALTTYHLDFAVMVVTLCHVLSAPLQWFALRLMVSHHAQCTCMHYTNMRLACYKYRCSMACYVAVTFTEASICSSAAPESASTTTQESPERSAGSSFTTNGPITASQAVSSDDPLTASQIAAMVVGILAGSAVAVVLLAFLIYRTQSKFLLCISTAELC